MSLFFPITIQAYKKEGSRVNGVWIDSMSAPFTFKGSVQPVRPYEYESLAQGRVNIGLVKIYTDYDLDTNESGGGTAGDIIEWTDSYWRVYSKAIYNNGLIPHKKYVAEFLRKI